jgi:hypothetical protein
VRAVFTTVTAPIATQTAVIAMMRTRTREATRAPTDKPANRGDRRPRFDAYRP